jgi:hypothetical protein
MSQQELFNLRDRALADRVRRAIGGIPGLRLSLVGEREASADLGLPIGGAARDARRLSLARKIEAARERVLRECRTIGGAS